MKTIEQLIARQEEINAQLNGFEGRELNDGEKAQQSALMREWEGNKRQITVMNQAREAAKNAPAANPNAQFRELVKKVARREVDGNIKMLRDAVTATDAITSGVIQTGETTNMASAGLPVTIGDLLRPLEGELIYDKLGIRVATGVRGQIQWPALNTAVEATVGGEHDEVEKKALDFSKITAVPVKLGLSIAVSNEAINDAAFDLRGTVVSELGAAIARTLNNRVLALAAPVAKPNFVGPLVSHKQAVTFAGNVPTYAEIKGLKGKVLKSKASMAGFCYVMDAEMYAALEATPKDTGSGRFIIENGKIDGDLVFITDIAAYSGKVAAGCFAYEALNQHGDMYFVVDPYTRASRNETVFTVNADFSLTYLVGARDTAPFAVGAKAQAQS